MTTPGSKVLENPKWEKFAQYVFGGMTQKEAYGKVGYKIRAGNMCRLAKRPEIQERIAFLQGKIAERMSITVEDIARQLDEDRAFAKARKNASAMVTATMGKAKVLGLVVNRHVVGAKRIEDMNELELKALLGMLETEKTEKTEKNDAAANS